MIAVRIDAPARLSAGAGTGTAPRWLGAVTSAVLSASITSLATLLLFGTVPLLWGWDSYTVVSGSMEPLLRRGDVVVVSPSDGRNLAVGTIVVITPDQTARPDGGGTTAETITHRIVERLPGGRYRTQGDANPVPDSRLIGPEAVSGTLELAVPLLGWPMLARQSGPVGILAVAVGVGMLVAAAGFTVSHRLAGRSRRRVGDGAGRSGRGTGTRVLIVVALATALTVAGRVPTAAVWIGKTANASSSYATRSAFYAQSVIASGPVSYWRLGEPGSTTTLVDKMGTVPMTRPATVTPGVAGALRKDGDTAMNFPNNTAAFATTGATTPAALAIGGPLSVAAWFKTGTNQNGNNRIVTKWNGNSGIGNINWLMAFSTTGTAMRFLVDTSNQRTTAISPVTTYNDNAWHFAVGVFDGTNVMLYLDGVQVASSPLAGTAPLHTAVADPVTVSYSNSPANNVNVDKVAVWSKALTAGDISTFYSLATT